MNIGICIYGGAPLGGGTKMIKGGMKKSMVSENHEMHMTSTWWFISIYIYTKIPKSPNYKNYNISKTIQNTNYTIYT